MKYVIRAFSSVDGKALYWRGGQDWTLELAEAAYFIDERATRGTVALLIAAGVVRGEAGAEVFGPTELVGDDGLRPCPLCGSPGEIFWGEFVGCTDPNAEGCVLTRDAQSDCNHTVTIEQWQNRK